MNARKTILILVCLGLLGCVSLSKHRELQDEVTGLNEKLLKKDEEIMKLRELVVEQEGQMKKKDTKIEELRKKLESFGVF